MQYQIEVYADWAEHELGEHGLCDLAMQKPDEKRWEAISPQRIGNGLKLTVAERMALGIKQVAPYDIAPEELKRRLTDRRNALQRARRRKRGVKPRALSLSRTKPWEAQGISRATLYRRLKRDASLKLK